ncbi:M20/M25/M40 family metallo-hydrolase [Arthrobacter sp. zg-Y20]|uniref:M20/M25/M40 family metallo-hydrolase n=1 Tax=unclassified Arthrobacter TaxID=235627 RepID=UPI001D141556|nr:MULTISPECIES: M20/M25/M40 family metallo-hydrolase [unclassified Arthrobacter]MCC3277461.1 M20/M25/M40 family metallo-hydrolase [Arthrobacter sp. zg-Y20]MDK1317621.1 M20/M25/M40 family metallo-hydrolase [Arthrobacter sp. zg.Y20]WIB05148.1 M20/M25/M40 family metallo-hydrolase [Arthrobacter sp. zg-Y20]
MLSDTTPRTAPATALRTGLEAAPKLARLLTFRTVSSRVPEEMEPDQFVGFIAALPELFPRVHKELEVERINGLGLLYRWPGSDTSGNDTAGPATADPATGGSRGPVVLMAHYDVVPVEDPQQWDHPPFAGTVTETSICGRGALDDKGALAAVLEATEQLLAEGFAPQQDLYFSFGNNEETAGDTAAAAADLLARRGIRPWLVLDEGGAVASGAFPFVSAPLAVVGVAEKGILDVELATEDQGGHASTPNRMGATARLARAVVRLDRRPFPAALPDVTVEMIERLSGSAPLLPRLVLGKVRRLRPVLTRVFGLLGGEPNAMTRTTVAVTQLRGSKGSNVLATRATANANIRVAVGSSVESTLAHLRKIISDPKVSLRVVEGNEPSPVSATDNAQFALLEASIRSSFPDAVPVPYIMLGGTDARRFTNICDAVYRFAPFRMSAADRASIHADNEKIGIETFGEGILFYRTLMGAL